MQWKTLSSKQVYRNPWISVREDAIIHPSGKEGMYGVVEIPNGIFAVATNEKDEILLVRQHHYPTGQWSWELPGGGLKENYTPEQQIIEELAEEAHVRATTFSRLGQTQTQPGVTTQLDIFFLAKGLSRIADAPPESQQDEGIDDVKYFPLSRRFCRWYVRAKSTMGRPSPD